MILLVLVAGAESVDIGRFYADTNGSIARQPIKLCPNMAGAIACNNMAQLQALPQEAVRVTDGFGRNAAMLAALFNSWAALQHLLQLPEGIDWPQRQTAQASLALLLRSFCS